MAGPAAGAEGPPEADLAAVFPDWLAWQRAAASLQEAIENFAALRSSPWAGPADLVAALRVKDRAGPEGRDLALELEGILSG